MLGLQIGLYPVVYTIAVARYIGTIQLKGSHVLHALRFLRHILRQVCTRRPFDLLLVRIGFAPPDHL